MKRIILFLTFSTLFFSLHLACSNEKNSSEEIQTIAFGSCASQDKDQPIWNAVLKKSPDLFLFLGDNIYADTEDMAVMKRKYEKLAAKPGYQELIKSTKILSVWDDHDYGVNDGDARYPKKKESEKIFLDFFGVDKDSPRRKRPGIYDAKIFGEANKKVQVILLDTRYFKGPQVPNRGSKEEKARKNIVGWYKPTEDTTTTLLGKAQWEWLEEQLLKEADVRIVASSIQVVPFEKGMESWGNFPHERTRLFNLIEKTKAKGLFFISGDVHFSEISKTNEHQYPLYDFTSSGLTNSNEKWANATNNYRLGEAYDQPNFGLINIDWKQKDPLITLETYSVEGEVMLKHAIRLNELQ